MEEHSAKVRAGDDVRLQREAGWWEGLQSMPRSVGVNPPTGRFLCRALM